MRTNKGLLNTVFVFVLILSVATFLSIIISVPMYNYHSNIENDACFQDCKELNLVFFFHKQEPGGFCADVDSCFCLNGKNESVKIW